MNPILIIARLTFREAVRRRIVLTALILGACFLVIYGIGFHLIIGQISQVAPPALNQGAQSEALISC